MQHAVHPVADAKLLLHGLEVNVGRAVLDRLRDKQVHELDNGCVFNDFFQAGEVIAAQEKEIAMMRAWLKARGQ